MFRNWLIVTVSVVALLVAAGCSGPAPAEKPAASGAASADKPAASKPAAPAKQKVVGLVQLVSHPSLDAAQKGVYDGLAQAGFKDGDNIKIDFQNAQGQTAATKTIADKFVADNVDLVMSISTAAGQSAAKAIQGTKTPLVFTSVTDAVVAGLIKSVDEPTNNNITGVYNDDPIKVQMALVDEILPNKIKNFGVIYNTGEANSVATVTRLKKELEGRGWKAVEATVSSSNDVLSAARSLVGRVDAIYMPQDNTVASGLEALLKTANEAKLPLIVADTESVRRGALATVSTDQYDMALQATVLAARVLKGEDAGKIKAEPSRLRVLTINLKTADAIGMKFPDSVLKRAQEIVK